MFLMKCLIPRNYDGSYHTERNFIIPEQALFYLNAFQAHGVCITQNVSKQIISALLRKTEVDKYAFVELVTASLTYI